MMPAAEKPQEPRDIVAPGGDALLDFESIQGQISFVDPDMKVLQFFETQRPCDLSRLAANHIDVSCSLVDLYNLQLLVLIGGPEFRMIFLHFSQNVPSKTTAIPVAVTLGFVSLGHVLPACSPVRFGAEKSSIPRERIST